MRFVSLVLFVSLVTVMPAAAEVPMHFGIDVAGAPAAADKGIALEYGSLWAGAWNQKHGWGGIEAELRTAKRHGLTPVVQWWYWGDDISPACVEQGCEDRYQRVWKDKATWYRLSGELAALIEKVMGHGRAVVILETEFNKDGMQRYEAFDGYLAELTRTFQTRGQQVVIGFGNWGYAQWRTFDRAARAADYLGIQLLYSSVREPKTYMTGTQVLIDGARRLQSMFGKPVFVTDFAFSSYPEPRYSDFQSRIVRDIMTRLPELKAAGVHAMVWRMFVDDPAFDTANYHGQAERHWGLVRANGRAKPALTAFAEGIARDRRGSSTVAMR